MLLPIIITALMTFACAAGLVVVVLVAWEERRHVPKVVPFCSRCGYELTGLRADEKCPECAAADPRVYRPLRESPARAAALNLCVLVPLVAGVPGLLLLLFWPIPRLSERLWEASAVVAVHVALAVLLRVVGAWVTPRAARTAAGLSTAPVGVCTLALAIAAFFGLMPLEPADVFILALCTLPLAAPGLGLAVWMSMRAPWCAPPIEPAPSQPEPAAPHRWTLDRAGRVRHE